MAPALFRARAFSAGLLTQLAFWSGQASFFLVLALYLQQGRGLSALNSGLVFTILAVSYVAASARAPELIARHGRRLLAIGALVLAAGHGLLLGAVADVGVGGSVLALVPGLLLIGAGMGLLIVPLTTTILSSVPAEYAGAALGSADHDAERRRLARSGDHRRDLLRRAARRLRPRARAEPGRAGGAAAGGGGAHPAAPEAGAGMSAGATRGAARLPPG